jgi:hypothetical protein
VPEHLVVARLLHVEDLALQRQDSLGAPVAALLCGAAGGVALNDEYLAKLRILFGAVRQLARKRRRIERTLARVRSRALRAASRARAASMALAMILRATEGFSSNVRPRFSLMNASTWPLTSEFSLPFRLPFELRLRKFDADDRDQSLREHLPARAFSSSFLNSPDDLA